MRHPRNGAMLAVMGRSPVTQPFDTAGIAAALAFGLLALRIVLGG